MGVSCDKNAYCTHFRARLTDLTCVTNIWHLLVTEIPILY